MLGRTFIREELHEEMHAKYLGDTRASETSIFFSSVKQGASLYPVATTYMRANTV